MLAICCKVMKAFLIFSGQILKKTIITLQALRFMLNCLNQTYISSKSMCSLQRLFFQILSSSLQGADIHNFVSGPCLQNITCLRSIWPRGKKELGLVMLSRVAKLFRVIEGVLMADRPLQVRPGRGARNGMSSTI